MDKQIKGNMIAIISDDNLSSELKLKFAEIEINELKKLLEKTLDHIGCTEHSVDYFNNAYDIIEEIKQMLNPTP